MCRRQLQPYDFCMLIDGVLALLEVRLPKPPQLWSGNDRAGQIYAPHPMNYLVPSGFEGLYCPTTDRSIYEERLIKAAPGLAFRS